ncbi:MAG: phosphatase PAP2 family protein [Dehalococcoidia bacterium]
MNPFDTNIILWLNGQAGKFQVFDDLMRIIASDYLMPLVFSAAMLALWFAGRTRRERFRFQMAMLIGISAIGISNLLVMLLNLAWDRPRPFVHLGDELTLLFYPPTDPSFPANPVAIGFAAGAAAWMVNRKLGIALFMAAAVYGFSRVYAGVFYPTDIIGGAAVGVAATWLTAFLGRVLQPIPALAIRLARAFALG